MTEQFRLELKDLRISYQKTPILKGIDIRLTQGRIQALIGPNGAGKSTTMRVLSGLSVAQSGTATLNGKILPHIFDIRKYCGFLIESPQFHEYLTGLENLKIFLKLSGAQDKPESLLDKVGLGPHKNKKFRQYSRGMKQRLGIAQAIMGNPEFLILDEPFHGLDPEVKLDFIKLFRMLADQGTGILITSHLLSEIEEIADDFVLLNHGEVFLAGKMSDYSGERQHVKFFFNHAIQKLPDLSFEVELSNSRIDAYLTRQETEQMLQLLVKENQPPYKVERSSILYDKYMEIAS